MQFLEIPGHKPWSIKIIETFAFDRRLARQEREHMDYIITYKIKCDCPLCLEGKMIKDKFIEQYWMIE